MPLPNLAAQPRGLLLHLDANRTPDPQSDPGHGFSLAGARPVPDDGLQTWEFLEVPVILAWHLSSGLAELATSADAHTGDAYEADDLGRYRGPVRSSSRSKRRSQSQRQSQSQRRSLQRASCAGPQLLQPPPEVSGPFSIALWARFPDSLPVVLLQLGPAGALILQSEGLELGGGPRVQVPRGRWLLLCLLCAHGHVLVTCCWRALGVERLGNLGPWPQAAKLTTLGGGETTGCTHLQQLALWNRGLEAREVLQLFAADAPRFGCLTRAQADALQSGRPVSRDSAQEAEFRDRLVAVRAGSTVADFAHFTRPGGFKVSSHDLPDILQAAEEGGAEELLLSGATLDADDVRDVVEALRRPGPLRSADVAGCEAVGSMRRELLTSFPLERGCCLEAADCGLELEDVDTLRNATEEAKTAAAQWQRAEAEAQQRSEAMCRSFMDNQLELEERAAMLCTREGPPSLPGHVEEEEEDGGDAEGEVYGREVRAQQWEAEWRAAQARQGRLSFLCQELYDAGPRPALVASGQLVAHFSLLCGASKPVPLDNFGFKLLAEAPRPKPRWGPSLHEALATKGSQLTLVGAMGRGFGKDCLSLKLENAGDEELSVVVLRGSIFQHVDWQHRQNLLVAYDYRLVLPARSVQEKQLTAYCMNLTCACCRGNPMELTELYFDDCEACHDQGAVWDHFEGTCCESDYADPLNLEDWPGGRPGQAADQARAAKLM